MSLFDLGAFASMLTPVVGVARGAHRDPARRQLWIWLTMLGVQEFCVWLTATLHHRTWWFTWPAYPISVWLGLTALLGFAVMRPLRRYRWPTLAAYVAIWLLGLTTSERASGFASYAGPIHALILAGLGVALLVRSGMEANSPDRRTAFPAGLATALTYGPSIAIWPLSTILSTSESRWLIPVWEVKAVFGILGLALFCLALWSPEASFGRHGASDKVTA